jgi:UDP:flavonoid glycosyltransferase YjiC (YdhE family)
MDRPNILFAAATFNLAETTRMIEIAKASMHHFQPHFCGYGGPFAHLIGAAGFPFHPLQPELTPQKIDYLWKIDQFEAFGDPFTDAELQQRVCSELALYHELRPAAVVMGSVLSTSISARVAAIPLVNVVPLPMSRPYLMAGMDILPDFLPNLPRLPRQAITCLINGIVLYVPLMTGAFNRVAASYGLRRFPSLVGVWEGDYNLVTDIPLATGLPTLLPNWSYIGPIFANLEGETPPFIVELAAKRERPLIYFAMGSSGQPEVVKTVLESFDGLPVDVIAPIQAYLERIEARVPPNVHVTDWLPAPKVNSLVDLAVIHGGQGTVQTTLVAGCPFVGIGMQPEQDINIQVAVNWGSALHIPKKRVTTAALRNAVQTLLNDQYARERARLLQAEYQKWDGAANAARFLSEQFGAAQRPPSPRKRGSLSQGWL